MLGRLLIALALAAALLACGPSASPSTTAFPTQATISANPPTPSAMATPSLAPAASPTAVPARLDEQLTSPTATRAAASPVARAAPSPAALQPGPAGVASAPTFSGEQALENARWLAEAVGSRPAGSPVERQAAEGLRARLAELGYTTRLQAFPIRRFEDRGSSLRLADEPGSGPAALALANSASGNVRGPLVDVGLGRREDLVGRDLRGVIALVGRGQITFTEKVRNVAAAGAAGAVVYNDGPSLVRPTLADAAPIPAVPALALSGDDGRRLRERLRSGPITAELRVDAAVHEGNSQNVVAELPGVSDRVVILGAHYDSVAEGPGANDNASGVGVVLELARAARASDLPMTIRVVLFGSEEIGLAGSRAYVTSLGAEERPRIAAMLDFDMVGVGDRPALSNPTLGGTRQQLGNLVADLAARSGTRIVRIDETEIGLASDHASFVQVGLPALFFHRIDDPRYHTSEDRITNVDSRGLAEAGDLALRLLAELAAR